jgi:hypothetical protein
MSGADVAGHMGRDGKPLGERGARRLKRLLVGRPGPESSYEPQPGDVPVTVATAVILLLLLLLMALL